MEPALARLTAPAVRDARGPTGFVSALTTRASLRSIALIYDIHNDRILMHARWGSVNEDAMLVRGTVENRNENESAVRAQEGCQNILRSQTEKAKCHAK